MLRPRDHETLAAARRLFAAGRNEEVLALGNQLASPWPSGVTFYVVAALINLEQRTAAADLLSGALGAAQGRERADLIVLEGMLSAYRGDADTYGRKAAEANALCATQHTLYHLGMAAGSPRESLRVLQASLIAAEEAEDDYAEARNAHALAVAHLNAGRFKEASGWCQYAFDRTQHPGLKLSISNSQGYLRLLSGELEGLEATLEATLSTVDSTAYARHKVRTRTLIADLYQASGRFEAALQLYTSELQQAQRALRAWLTLGCVRAQCALGHQQAAREQAEATAAITETLAPYHQQQARLAVGLAHWPDATALPYLLEAYRYFAPRDSAPRDSTPRDSTPRDSALATEAALHLSALEGLDADTARELEATIEHAKLELTEVGLRFLAGQAYSQLAHLSEDVGVLKIFLLGRLEVHQHGKPLTVRQRSAELLLLLASRAQGFGAEELSDALYGDFRAAGLRVELYRLRKDLGVQVEARPYRLASKVWLDVTEFETLLERGKTHEAVQLYGGPLLPQSTAPFVVELRRALEAELHAAVVHTDDTELIWELAQIMPFDLELWETLVVRLAPDDPRHGVAAGRSARVRSELDFS